MVARQRGGQVIQRLLLARGEDEARAALGQRRADRPPEATGRSGQKDRLAIELHVMEATKACRQSQRPLERERGRPGRGGPIALDSIDGVRNAMAYLTPSMRREGPPG